MPERMLSAPPDQAQREQALDPTRSVMVQAPAGSGKTDLLTRRFLRLLAKVDDPSQIVAITFTRAAAAEMRNRILGELEKASAASTSRTTDEFSMEMLAALAVEHSQRRGWNLIELSSQLRISTIDSFCAKIAARRPLLSELGSGLRISENPAELYLRAARATLMQLGRTNAELGGAIELLLEWRDNGWTEIESHLVEMLRQRDRWMQGFVLSREQDWDRLRERLERPFARAIRETLTKVDGQLSALPGARGEAMALARFACANHGSGLHRELAELADFPSAPWQSIEEMEDARRGFECVANLVLKDDGEVRGAVDKRHGFPAGARSEKARLLAFARDLAKVPALQSALHSIRTLPPARYTEDDWRIVRACFTLLHHAAGQLKVAFAEAGVADFVEVAQAARHVLQDENQQPTEAAFVIADGIRHLLVDEFQDTSRRQHQLIAALVSAGAEPAGRTLFVVGDPMQSIYFFRDADAELFPRVQSIGLELSEGERHWLDDVRLTSNFRTAPELVAALNRAFQASFAEDDSSGIHFGPSEPALPDAATPGPGIELHVQFVPQLPLKRGDDADSAREQQETAADREESNATQINEIVALIQQHLARIEHARACGDPYRIAVLGRTKATLTPIAQALRQAKIPFRSVELEPLAMRPEVLDALALARALQYSQDRVAWLGVLRAPWCGLSLADLHRIAGDSDAGRTIPDLLRERLHHLSTGGRSAATRVLAALDSAPMLHSAFPASALGTWLQQVWLSVGGGACVDAEARNNLDMLWRCLDRLPDGEPDLLGRELNQALEKLSAQSHPDASAEHGVQLMTMHKSKGLEFEIVIVPGLHAGARKSSFKMLSWLERGLAEPDDTGEITEFLIAPFQTKGEDRGKAKIWVDAEYRERERQEMRRIFYVAATRAREELHLFTRIGFKRDSWELCKPVESLLSVAWPAFEPEIRSRFAVWQSRQRESEVADLAASGNNLITMSAPRKHAVVRRLPAEYQAPEPLRRVAAQTRIAGIGAAALFARHDGGMESRILGTAIHACLEGLARLRTSASWDEAHAELPSLLPHIQSHARSSGMDRNSAEQLARKALEIGLGAAQNPVAAWILSPHADAANEARWTGIVSGAIHTVQVDRVFRAGPEPLSQDGDTWWIIDYKSAHPDLADPAEALPSLRPLFTAQLESYAEVLRGLHGRDIAIRAGLYYPRLCAFDWWEL